MVLTKKQEEGLQEAVRRYNNKEPYTCIAGYAGTGKSTLVRFIIDALGFDPEDVCYIAYTGKAALVLREKGCPNAMTSHKLLYQSFRRPDGAYVHKPKRPLDEPYRLIIVDEVSMLPRQIWELLLSHRIHVIALGDPFQLPPIGDDNGILQHPHIFLDEIMRQAQESEIIRLTMDIRAGKPLQLMNGNDVMVLNRNALTQSMLTWADQVICGKNATRHMINDTMRHQKFGLDIPPSPVDGDKIICLRNDYNTFSDIEEEVLVNGLIGYIGDVKVTPNYPIFGTGLHADFIIPDYNDTFTSLHMDYKLFVEKETFINKDNFRKVPAKMHPKEFDYGYAITCHKAQGSQYSNVLVLEEWLNPKEHSRWLYTACTRPTEKLVVIKNY